MAKRARYDGPHPLVFVEVEGEPKPIAVERGHLLPAEVAASVRDSLLEQDDWSSVDQPTGPKKDGEEG